MCRSASTSMLLRRIDMVADSAAVVRRGCGGGADRAVGAVVRLWCGGVRTVLWGADRAAGVRRGCCRDADRAAGVLQSERVQMQL